jgi:hypothetical protein
LARVRCLPDGRWFDAVAQTWRDRRGRPAPWPDLIEATTLRQTRVVLAAAHLDNNPANNRLSNLRGLCQRCHMLHDRPFHLVQRWLTYRRRWAIGDSVSWRLRRAGAFAGVVEHDRPAERVAASCARWFCRPTNRPSCEGFGQRGRSVRQRALTGAPQRLAAGDPRTVVVPTLGQNKGAGFAA